MSDGSIPMAAREELIFAFLCRKYVQRAQERHVAMGLQYMEAETHDLAREIDKLIETLTRPSDDVERVCLRERVTAIEARGDESCNGKWGEPLCPNAFRTLDRMCPVMRCRLTGKHPDECVSDAVARPDDDRGRP